ncbi:MAG: MBL fold metallo-hydrolase [Myxococcales bacterium]|nr:MBL fold metallo-hydrolase [Myxococcales bacterium]
MKIEHIRNATALVTLGEHRLLVDPMLCEPGAIIGLKFFGGGRRRNPLVPLPDGTLERLAQASAVLVTHRHPDHLDPAGIDWIKARGLPVFGHAVDVPRLRRKGLDARALDDHAFGFATEVIPTVHGHGVMGWLMGPMAGFYLAHPDEPSIYITGDTVLTDAVLDAVSRLRPDVILAPAGAANFGFGKSILMTVDEQVALVRAAPGEVVFNHLEALDHCPTTRTGLAERMRAEGLDARVFIPEDGETLELSGTS